MKTIFIAIIRFYRKNFTTLVSLGGLLVSADCRWWPSCSFYTEEAIENYGWRKGLLLSIKRILHCHPWSKGGIDLVPD